MSRINRDELFMEVARTLAKRSTCERGQVGAVIVKDQRIISTGYNGAPPGMPHCTDVGCDPGTRPGETYYARKIQQLLEERGCQRAVHAEANAIAFAARYGVSVEDATMYCIYTPCLACAQLVLSAGISEYIYEKEYRVAAGMELLDRGLVVMRPYALEPDRGQDQVLP